MRVDINFLFYISDQRVPNILIKCHVQLLLLFCQIISLNAITCAYYCFVNVLLPQVLFLCVAGEALGDGFAVHGPHRETRSITWMCCNGGDHTQGLKSHVTINRSLLSSDKYPYHTRYADPRATWTSHLICLDSDI